jgi:acetyltransferase-like isoleucine patch superfamily enzyme
MSGLRQFSPMRSARFRVYRFLGWLRLSCSRVTLGGSVSAFGMPVVSMCPGSECYIGEGSRLISVSFATALGVNHPVVLRTLRPEARIRIGARVGMSGGTICASKLVAIGDDTLLGANVTIADTDFHSPNPDRRASRSEEDVVVAGVTIGKKVFVGTNAIILKGVSIGDNSVIGAGSVVTKSIPANVVAAGNPCRPIKSLEPAEAIL